MSVRILLADDHAIMRQGLSAILANEPDLEVVGEAQNGREAVTMAAELNPDVVVMDIGMPDLNGVEATHQLMERHPQLKVVALSAFTARQFVLAMLKAGAVGYVIKGAAGDELLEAIRAAVENRKYLSPELAGAMGDRSMSGYCPDHPKLVRDLLSLREREVLQLLAAGKTSREIATELEIAEGTVVTHRRNTMQKLRLHSVAELTKFAVRGGLTTL